MTHFLPCKKTLWIFSHTVFKTLHLPPTVKVMYLPLDCLDDADDWVNFSTSPSSSSQLLNGFGWKAERKYIGMLRYTFWMCFFKQNICTLWGQESEIQVQWMGMKKLSWAKLELGPSSLTNDWAWIKHMPISSFGLYWLLFDIHTFWVWLNRDLTHKQSQWRQAQAKPLIESCWTGPDWLEPGLCLWANQASSSSRVVKHSRWSSSPTSQIQLAWKFLHYWLTVLIVQWKKCSLTNGCMVRMYRRLPHFNTKHCNNVVKAQLSPRKGKDI